MVGALAEKELATPQQYPLTLNALVLACNQTSNRDPVVAYDEPTVEAAIDELRQKRLARIVYPSHGRSATRYRVVLDEALGLDERQRALLAVLLLRGPQTVGELRTRTERLARFDDLADVEAQLVGLGEREEPLVERLPRRPGQKEERYAQTLLPETERAGGGEPGPANPANAGDAGDAGGAGPAGADEGAARLDDIGELRAQVAELAATVATMRRQLDDLVANLGG